MKTPQVFAEHLITKIGLSNNFWFEAMEYYAKEAIKEDRLNIAYNHAKLNVPTNDWQQRWVDQDSIISAPQISFNEPDDEYEPSIYDI